MADDCLICDKHRDSTFEVCANEYLVVNHFVPRPDKDDNYLGYYMIESARHFKGFYDASQEEALAFGKAQRVLSMALKSALKCEHVYIFVLGDGIPHLHVHVIAKYNDAPREFWGPRVDEWSDAPRGGKEEVLRINKLVGDELRNIGCQE